MKNGSNCDVKYPADWTMVPNSLSGSFDDENYTLESYKSRRLVNVLRNTGYVLMISLGKYQLIANSRNMFQVQRTSVFKIINI